MLNIRDRNFSFEFHEFDQLEFRDDQVDNSLTALLAYYAYLIIGVDMDGMAELGGTEILQKAGKTWPGISTRTNITNFSGIRAHLTTDDFMVGPVSGCKNAYEAVGIESPGLSSAPAIAADLCRMIAEDLKWNRKADIGIRPALKREKAFASMTAEERAEMVRKDPLYGNIVCRCETVTEAEIRQAVRRPVGARTIDGVKRRTRAGMGRCQGGFCLPRVAAIIAEETGCSLAEVTKDGGCSRILADPLDSFLKGGGDRE